MFIARLDCRGVPKMEAQRAIQIQILTKNPLNIDHDHA